MLLNMTILCGLCCFFPRQVQTCFPWHENSCRNKLSTSFDGNVILDYQIKTHDGWVARVEFLWETPEKRAQSATALHNKNINDLHFELSHPPKSITCATATAMGIQITGTFNPCEDCALGKAQNRGVSKKAVDCSKILGDRLFFNISSLSSSTFGGKEHWLLVMEDSSDYGWGFFLKEKSNLAVVVLG